MVKVINNQIVAHNLPETGYLSDGSSVSGYDKLPLEVLQLEGWLPLAEEMPKCGDNQHLELYEHRIELDKVVRVHVAVDNVEPPKPPISEEEKYRDMVNQLMSAYLQSFETN